MKGKRSRTDLVSCSITDNPVESKTDQTTSDEEPKEPRKKVMRSARSGPGEKPPSSPTTKQDGQSGKVVFVLEPFETDEGNGDSNKPTKFLDDCHFCKKAFSEETDIFMYSCFLAFCTPQCRVLYAAKENAAKKRKTA